ncbi:hypothetical protein [Gemmobacter caeni]|uniref:hypothetical protein n=1 Tax=Gemmobacter caeni TaxID=589035 RepID=UPI0011A160A3|nr:hypothetical protein [Gemmobacter caeni]
MGALRVAMGFALAGDGAAAARYLGSSSPGEAIDQGLYTMIFAISLGILTEISRAVARRTE